MDLSSLAVVLVSYFIGGTGAIAAYSYRGDFLNGQNPDYILLSASVGMVGLATVLLLRCLAQDFGLVKS